MIPLLNEGPSVETGLLVYSYGVLIATTHGNATPYRWCRVSVGALCALSSLVFSKKENLHPYLLRKKIFIFEMYF